MDLKNAKLSKKNWIHWGNIRLGKRAYGWKTQKTQKIQWIFKKEVEINFKYEGRTIKNVRVETKNKFFNFKNTYELRIIQHSLFELTNENHKSQCSQEHLLEQCEVEKWSVTSDFKKR